MQPNLTHDIWLQATPGLQLFNLETSESGPLLASLHKASRVELWRPQLVSRARLEEWPNCGPGPLLVSFVLLVCSLFRRGSRRGITRMVGKENSLKGVGVLYTQEVMGAHHSQHVVNPSLPDSRAGHSPPYFMVFQC